MPPKEPSDSVPALVTQLQHRTALIYAAVAPSSWVPPASPSSDGINSDFTAAELEELRAAVDERKQAGSLADGRLREIEHRLDESLFRRTEWTDKRANLRISFNEKLVVLAGATITLSISFLTAISATKSHHWLPLLWASWLCLTSSIIGALSSNWFSSHMFGITERFIIEALDHRLEHEAGKIYKALGSLRKEEEARASTGIADDLRVVPAKSRPKANNWLDAKVEHVLDEQLKQQLYRIAPSACYSLGLFLLMLFVVKNL